MISLLLKLMGDPNEKKVKKMLGIVDHINALEPEFEKLSDEELKAKTQEFKDILFSREDLFCLGIIGLIKAVDTFDISKNYAFSTYAVKCIQNEILMKLRKRKLFECSIYDKINDSLDEEIISCLKEEENIHEKLENKMFFRNSLYNLSEKETIVLELLYQKELTTSQIGELLNLSQSYVCRVKLKALKKMKEYYLSEPDKIKVNKLKY